MSETEPLASQIRPTNLDEFVGQSHLVGLQKPLRLAIQNKQRFSFILWGPPGVGKTTMAKIYANALEANFVELSAVSAGKADIKKAIDHARTSDKPTILFLDEIHRFNKAQQDFLLPYVESGILTLIGATTENPSFEVISPLLSRCRVFILYELGDDDISLIIDRSLSALSKTKKPIVMDQEARDWLIRMANGDARQTITMLENTYHLYRKLTVDTLQNTLQNKFLRFDKQGEEHYNTISAFIKSMRASQPDAALYYLARMIEAGQDPLFIARRMVIFASEDIGMAQPTALVVANEVFRACDTIGYPECAINLAHGVVYLAKSPKNRSAYNGLRAAQKDVQDYGNLPIPMNLRNAPTKLMKEAGYGKGYNMYDKDSYLPEKIQHRKYYQDKEK